MMKMGLYNSQFSEVFSRLLEKAGVSCYEISRQTHLDQAYLSRLKSGEKDNPSVETVMKISLALYRYGNKLTLYDIEKLFNSIGSSMRFQ